MSWVDDKLKAGEWPFERPQDARDEVTAPSINSKCRDRYREAVESGEISGKEEWEVFEEMEKLQDCLTDLI